MKTLGIGIVGWGFMGKAHAYGYKNMRLFYEDLPFNVKLVGVCNRSEGKLQSAILDAGFEYSTTDYNDLLNDENIHIIHVCTPNVSHKEIAVAAAKAGKHVYCDKPMAMDVHEAEQMQKAAEDYGVINKIAFHNRYYPSIIKAKEIIDKGLIGDITTFRGMYYHSGSVSPDKKISWRFIKSEAGGGALFDLGSHVIDLLSWLMGDIVKVFCKTRILNDNRMNDDGNFQEVDVDDHAALIIWLKNDAFGNVEATKIATGTEDELIIEIHGTKGAVKFNSTNVNQIAYYDGSKNEGFTYIDCSSRYESPGGGFPASKSGVGWIRGHAGSIYDFANSVYKNEQTAPSFADGVKNQKILAAAYKSDITGRIEKV